MKKKRVSGDTKILLVLFLILIVCFAVIGFLFYKFFYAGAGATKYGDRLEGIEKYKLSKTLEKDIQDIYTDNNSVNTVKVDVQGKIIYIMVDFKESLKDFKSSFFRILVVIIISVFENISITNLILS